MLKNSYFDISPKISEEIAVWPGDTRFQRKILADFKKGDNLLLSSIEATLHLGAHADAPCHYSEEGSSIEARDLSYYFGPCQVVDVSSNNGRIYPEEFATEVCSERILFKTGSFPDPKNWRNDFRSLSPELVAFLAEKGCRLIGIDTPSVDPFDSKALESHQEVFRQDLAVLEGLTLESVPEGVYWLSALPLPLEGADASPVRAVLFELESLKEQLKLS